MPGTIRYVPPVNQRECFVVTAYDDTRIYIRIIVKISTGVTKWFHATENDARGFLVLPRNSSRSREKGIYPSLLTILFASGTTPFPTSNGTKLPRW